MFIPFGLNQLLQVGGLTSVQVRDVITEAMKANFRNPVVQVVQTKIESRKVILSGEVRFPGTYAINGATRLLDVVAGIGGFTSQSNLAEVSVFRSINGEVYNKNVLEALLGISPDNNILLEPSDIVFVPSVQNVSNKTFVILEGRSIQLLQTTEKINLLEALARAGILGSKLADVQVLRLSPKDGFTEVSRVKFDDIYRKADLSLNIPLENGDIVFLPKSGMARLTETMTSISPLLAVIRDTVLFQSIFKKSP